MLFLKKFIQNKGKDYEINPQGQDSTPKIRNNLENKPSSQQKNRQNLPNSNKNPNKPSENKQKPAQFFKEVAERELANQRNPAEERKEVKKPANLNVFPRNKREFDEKPEKNANNGNELLVVPTFFKEKCKKPKEIVEKKPAEAPKKVRIIAKIGKLLRK